MAFFVFSFALLFFSFSLCLFIVIAYLHTRASSQKMLTEFATEAGAIGAKQEVMDEGAAALRSSLERGMEALRAHNRSALARHLKAAVKEARLVINMGKGEKRVNHLFQSIVTGNRASWSSSC